jgi:peptidoglycan/LPS O-acetylase OafA/YrhL
VRRLSTWIGALGVLLLVLTGVLIAFGPGDWLGYLELGGAACGAILIAALGIAAERRAARPDDRGLRRLPDLSLPTVLVVIGVAVALDGLAFGLWLILIGLLIVLLGGAALVRELTDERRDAA